jgi:hypothetical protein
MAYIILVDGSRIAGAAGTKIGIQPMVRAVSIELVESTDVRVANRCLDLISCAHCVHARYEPGCAPVYYYSDGSGDPGEPAYYYCGKSDELEEAQGEVGEEYANGCADFLAKQVTACEVCQCPVPLTVRDIPEEDGPFVCGEACKDRYVAEIIAADDWSWDAPYPVLPDIEIDEVI